MAKLPGVYELMATAASPAINFGRGILGYQDPFTTQTMQDRMAELEAGRTKGNIGYEDYGLQTATPGGRFTGGLMDLALNNPVDFGLAGSIGRYSFSPQGRTGLNYDFTPDQDTGSTGSAMLDFINAGGLKGAFSKMGQAQAAEITPSNTGIMSTPYTDRIMDPGSMRSAAYRSIENAPYQEIPGFNFKDAPTSLKSRLTNREFLNNPRTGFIDNTLMQTGNPGNSIIDKTKNTLGKGFNLGKTAIGGLASLVSGIPGLGLLANAFGPMSPEDKAMRDFYGSQFGLTDTGQVASGIMKGYNPVSLFGSTGLNQAIDKRIARIQKTLKKKKSETLKNRLKELQALKAKESAASSAALEAQRRGRRPSAPSGDGGTKDSGGPTGGYSYDAGGREGFGYGLKNGGLAGLL